MLSEHNNKNYSSVPTAKTTEEDFFYYVNKEDEDAALESLGYNARGCISEDDLRVQKFW